MSDHPASPQLEIHKLVSEELRHTATVVWQFAIAIVSLQGGAVALSSQAGFDKPVGKVVSIAAFFLSICFSLMLVRQARERGGFVDRIKAIEAALVTPHPVFAIPIPTTLRWFTSEVLAWILVVESVIGFVFFLGHVGVLRRLCELICR